MALNKNKLREYISLIDNNKENFALLKSAYKSNVQNVGQDLDGITFDNWQDVVSQALSDYKDYLNTGVVLKLKDSIATNGTFDMLDKLITDLRDKCQSCLDYTQRVNDKYLNIFLPDEDSSFFWAKEVISTPESAHTHEYTTQEVCVELNTQLSSYFSAIEDTLSKIKELKFDDVVDYELTALPDVVLPSAYVEEPTPIVEEPKEEPVNVEPVVINQFDQVEVYMPPEPRELTAEQEQIVDAYHRALYELNERSNGRIFIREVAEEHSSDEFANVDLQYYYTPEDYLRGLCEITGEDINDFIGADGKITKEGYERIIDSSYGRFWQSTLMDPIVFIDPDMTYLQDFVDAGVIDPNDAGFYDRYTTVRCYETIEEFEAAYFGGEDEFLNTWVNGEVNCRRTQYIIDNMVANGLIASNTTITASVMYYLGTDSKGRSYFSYSLDKNAKVYRGYAVNDLNTSQTYLNDLDKLGDPMLGSTYASARIGFVLTGGNTGDIVVKNVLNGPNGAYTDDAAFNTSIVYDDPSLAPTVVSRGDSSYTPKAAYHVVSIAADDCVSLYDAFNSDDVSLSDDHPVIVVKAGESIVTKYGWIKTKQTISGTDDGVYLVWDNDLQRYYVVDDRGYSTSQAYMGKNYGRGYKYVTMEALGKSNTVVKANPESR